MPLKTLIQKKEKVWLEIDGKMIGYNVSWIRQWVGSQVSLLGVVKADAYGLGVLEISKVLLENGAHPLGVTNVQEGIYVKKHFPQASVVILGPSFLDHVEEILEWDLVPMASSLEFLKRLNEVALVQGKSAKVHLMMDTGMGRIGLWYEKGEEFFKALTAFKAITIEGVASHFASSDEENLDFSKLQLKRFQEFLFQLKVMGFEVGLRHMANSAALLRMPDSFLNMVRPGILLYGIYPSSFCPRKELKTALSWKTRIAFIKEVERGRTVSYGSTFVASSKTKIATLPVGYCHGYDRQLSNQGEVLIDGRRCRVVGRVTMDQIMVDLGFHSPAKVGDEAVLVGKQGDEEVTFEELAERAQTIPHELLSRLKVQKYYH
ncbi:MAG: alanine racemase [Chlamydiae bacterium]|nr:alanine racemase [Chlamydiota bacterium]MBI3266663.1 alanine racemase [Chlamydiota bacterium]